MRSAVLPALLFCGSPVLAGDVIPPQPVEGTIKWVYDYAEGKRVGQATGKPLWVVIRCER
jgi:hypothetical protein